MYLPLRHQGNLTKTFPQVVPRSVIIIVENSRLDRRVDFEISRDLDSLMCECVSLLDLIQSLLAQNDKHHPVYQSMKKF